MESKVVDMIQKKRPQLSVSSVKTYKSLLISLYDKVCKNNDCSFEDFLTQEKKILNEILKYPLPKAKTTLSALFIVTGNNPYRRDMIDLCKKDNEFLEKQQATETQKNAWVTQQEIKEKFDSLYPTAIEMVNGKNVPDFVFLNAFMLFSVMSGVLGIPPRRPSDFCDMYIRGEFNKNSDNYYNPKTGNMVINKYKTAKFYGTYAFNVKNYSTLLYELLKKWCKLNTTNFLFFSKIGDSVTPSIITHYNNKIWNGRKISSNAYRHSFLTDFYSHQTPTLLEMNNLGKAMGHDQLTALKYVKIDMPA